MKECDLVVKHISIPVFYSVDDEGNVLFDFNEMRNEFERRIDLLNFEVD